MPGLPPMRIIHVTNIGTLAKGAFWHGVPHKITNGLIRNGHHVLNFNDREVARAATPIGHKRFGAGSANAQLVKLCVDFEPHAVFLGHADVIRPETLGEIRRARPGVMLLQWNVDPLFDAGNLARLESKLAGVDATLISTAGAPAEALGGWGRTVGYLPNPADKSIETARNFERDDLAYDLFYAAGHPRDPRHHCGRVVNVEDVARTIQAGAPRAKCGFFGILGHGNVVGAGYQRVLESARMGLSLSRRSDNFLYSSDRMAHLVGNGILTLVDRATGFGTLFGEDELAFYGTEAELIDKINRFVADDAARKAAARKGWEKYHAIFNEALIARYMLDFLFAPERLPAYPWSDACYGKRAA